MDSLSPYEFMRNNREYFEDFVSRASYHSNRIEGNTLTLAETYAIQWSVDSMPVTATPRELYEAINHKLALTVAMQDLESGLAGSLIIRIARAVNHNIAEIDSWRRVAVMIRGAEHVPPQPAQVPTLMMEAEREYAIDLKSEVDPFLREARFHVRFERIHPFEDGNGRTGRILIERGLMRDGVAPAVIRAEDRARYLEGLASLDIDDLASLIAERSHDEQERMEAFRRAAGEKESRTGGEDS